MLDDATTALVLERSSTMRRRTGARACQPLAESETASNSRGLPYCGPLLASAPLPWPCA